MNITEKKKTYDENLALLRAYREGDRSAGERLAEINTPLVYSIAAKLSARVSDPTDLVECGMVGLVKAFNTFDFSHGCAFSTYAVPLIFGEIRRFLRDDGMIKVSREEKRLAAVVNAERERRITLGEPAGITDIAAGLGMERAAVASALCAAAPVRSLDECAYADDEGVTLGSTVFDEDEEQRVFDRLSLTLAIERLGEWQRRLIILRYFRDFSQVECAAALGCTQVKISREEKKILTRLREELS